MSIRPYPSKMESHRLVFSSTPRTPTTTEVNKDDTDLPSFVLATLVILLLLLAILIWIAFCMAVQRTARRMAMFKRQRRTQTIIAAAISRAVNEGARTADAALSSGTTFSLFARGNNQRMQEQLPTYEEALGMEQAPPSIAIIGGLPPRPIENTDPPPYVKEAAKPGRVLRMAPERPGCSSSVMPPSYDNVVSQTRQRQSSPSSSPSTSRSRVPVYSIPIRDQSTDV